jgi:hypothetical protein
MKVKSNDIVVMFALFAEKWQNKRFGHSENKYGIRAHTLVLLLATIYSKSNLMW